MPVFCLLSELFGVGLTQRKRAVVFRFGDSDLLSITAAEAVVDTVCRCTADEIAEDDGVLLTHACMVSMHINRGSGGRHLFTDLASQRSGPCIGITIGISVPRPCIILHIYGSACTSTVLIMDAGKGVALNSFYQKNDNSFFSKLAHMLSLL